METMLYAAAQRQIQKAIERCGIKSQTTKMAVLVLGNDPKPVANALQDVKAAVGSEIDEEVLELTPQKTGKIKTVFEVTDTEINAAKKEGETEKDVLVNLVVQRMALLATQF